MITWLSANLGTILVALVVAAVVAAVICTMRRDKKNGKSSCGGSCSSCGAGCASCGGCSTVQQKK